MNPRERILLAVNHQEPDTLPIALWGSAYGITDPLYFKLVETLGLGEPLPPFRARLGHSVNHYDDRVLEALDVDVRHVWTGFTDLAGPPSGGGKDAWGIGWKQSGIYLSPMESPLAKAKLDIIESYSWPQPENYMRLDELKRRAKHLKENTPFAVVGRAFDSYGPLERSSQLRGYGQLMMDLAIDPPLAEAVIQKVTDVIYRGMQIYLETAGEYLDIIELPGDDYAASNPLISPRMFDRFFAPAWKRLIHLIKDAAPHCKIMFHSDGRMEPFLGRLIDLGIDIFHCLEPMPNVEMAQIKKTYGDSLCFWGAIDIKQALQGNRARVETEVKTRIHELAQGGGYVLAPANHLQPDVPPENVIALFRAAREFGRYA